jgi:signal transduction histidine kinase
MDKNLTFLTPQISEQHIIVKKYFSDNLPEAMADSDMLYQSFLNILINAMQAMPSGGEIQIEINSNQQDIIIIIEDEGEGISEENMEKIWNPFFTTKDMGTGLGLSIVKNIIESHGGTIDIENNHPLRGTKVTVTLPAKKGV